MEMSADRFTVAVVFAIDISSLVAGDLPQQQRLQRQRSTGELCQSLRACFGDGDNAFGEWVNESARIRDRMDRVDREGGIRVWSRRFLDNHSPMLQTNHNHALAVDRRVIHEDGRLDPSGRRYRRRTFFRGVGYRVTPEGAVVGTYQADFLDDVGYAVPEVIEALHHFREDALDSFRNYLRDFFGNPRRRRLLLLHTGLSFDRFDALATDEVETLVRRHQLLFIRGFWQSADRGRDRQRASLATVLRSGELAGILTEAPWYHAYGTRYLDKIRDKEIGHRGDEIYVVGHHSTVVVAERYWRNLYNEPAPDAGEAHRRPPAERDPLYWYQADLLTMVEHQLSRLALLRQQVTFFRDRSAHQPLEAERPADALPLVLDGRANLTQISESLDFISLCRHGFTREVASLLRREMGLDEQLDAVRRRIDDMSAAINLKSSVTSAHTENNIQRLALLISVMALLVSVVALVVSRG